MTDDSDAEVAYAKLEAMGYKVGMAYVERYIMLTNDSATADRSRFIDNLDVVKFICKDFWVSLFKKQIDNLKTNHKVSII